MTTGTGTEKYSALCAALARLDSLAVAFSGGADSTLLLRAAHDVLGDRVLAVTACSETYPAGELESARALAAGMGAAHVVIETKELDLPAFRRNPPDRCYHCKRELFERIREVASARGIRNVADGTNADDAGDYRPGERAARELGILTPLRDAHLTKSEIRELSRGLGLPTWNKPACACLASRFPYGSEITPEKLLAVDRAECVLRTLGFEQCRVRHHGDVARIEVDRDRVAALVSPAMRERVAAELKAVGFRYVAVDLEGYRTGSMNEVLGGDGGGR